MSTQSENGALADPERACHDLLVRLAGRLPDRLLWRLRDWLAADGHAALSRALPKALLRNRIGLTDAERDLMEASLPLWGATQRQLDAVLPVAEPGETNATFRAELSPEEVCADLAGPGGWRDSIDLMLTAVVRGHPGAKELRRSWRVDHSRPQRVVLAHVTEDLPALTGTLQRVLRAHGDLSPCVEVVSPPLALPPYHRLALRDSTSLWRPNERESGRPRRDSSGSLVDA
ncbi:MAG TPA: hypothetical protein VGH72_34070 [Pseudonocardia sp.]